MQTRFQKIILIFGFLMLNLVRVSAHDQPVSLLFSADSLFEKGQYQQAEKKYDSLFSEGFYSEKSLLSASMIAEASDNQTKTIQLLSLLQANYPNKEYLFKMEQYAQKNKLTGYSIQDEDWFENYIGQYLKKILITALGIVFLIVVYAFFVWFKSKKLAVIPVSIGGVLLVLIFIANNFSFSEPKVLIKKDTFLYEGASSASKVKLIYKKGFRAYLLSEGPVWSLVKVEDTEGYIKNNMFEVLGN